MLYPNPVKSIYGGSVSLQWECIVIYRCSVFDDLTNWISWEFEENLNKIFSANFEKSDFGIPGQIMEGVGGIKKSSFQAWGEIFQKIFKIFFAGI